MTSFIVNGEYLEYGGDVALTKQAVSFFDFKIKGDISVSFTIPNTSVNRRILSYYGFGQKASPAYSRMPATLVKDGNAVTTGTIIVETSTEEEINGYFVSGNSSWFDLLKFNIKDIDYSDFVVSADAHDSRKSIENGIIFPVVDWAFHGQKLGYTFCHSTGDGGLQEMFPCFFLHSLVSQIARHSGVKISGSLLNDYIFRHIIITPEGPDLAWPDNMVGNSLIVAKRSATVAMPAAVTVLPLDYVFEGPGNYDTANYRYYSYVKTTVKVSVDFRTGTSQAYSIHIYKNGSLLTTITSFTDSLFINFHYANMDAGDYIDVRAQGAAGYNLLIASSVRYEIAKDISSAYFDGSTSTPSSPKRVTHIPYTTPAAIVPSIDALEIIKWISFYFSCLPVYDQESNTLTLDPLITLRKEDAVDWSEFYVSHTLDWNTGAAKNNRIQTAEVDDSEIKTYNSQNLTRYGGGTVTTDFETETENELFEMPFAGSWDKPSQTNLKWFLPFIEFYSLENDTDNICEYTSVSNVLASGNTARFNFPGTNVIGDDEVVYIISSNGRYNGYGITYTTTSDQIFVRGVDFSVTDTGKIIRQKISTNSSGNRIMLCFPGSQVSSMGEQSNMVFRYANVGNNINVQPVVGDGKSPLCAAAWFDKPKLGYAIDDARHSLSIDNLFERGYNITMGDKYHSVMHGIFNGPRIKARLILPQTEYTGFNFSYIYIEAPYLKGYFLCEKIDRYLGPDTETEVWLYGGN